MKDFTKDILEIYKQVIRRNADRSFLEIAGFPSNENVVSNFLSYFFDVSENHGLGDTCVLALLHAAGIPTASVRMTAVNREVYTEGNKRIDLQIETDEMVIVVENKIFHQLNNPLEVYHAHVTQLANTARKIPIKIILSPQRIVETKETQAFGFKLITYADLFAHIEAHLRVQPTKASPKALLFLNDFMDGVKKLYQAAMEDLKIHQLFAEHEDEIERLLEEYQRRQRAFATEVDHVRSMVKIEAGDTRNIRQYIWKYTTLCHDMTLENSYIVSAEVVRKYSGWHFNIFVRGPQYSVVWKPEVLKQLTVLSSLPDWAERRVGNKVLFEKLEATDLATVASTMGKILSNMTLLRPDSP